MNKTTVYVQQKFTVEYDTESDKKAALKLLTEMPNTRMVDGKGFSLTKEGEAKVIKKLKP